MSSTRQPKPADLTRQHIALATHVARNEIAKQGSHIRVAVAQLHPGTVRQSNTGHTCESGTLLRVTMIGSFPHTTVSPTPGGDATVHAEVVEANPSTGEECLVGVKTGQVHLPDGATRLASSAAQSPPTRVLRALTERAHAAATADQDPTAIAEAVRTTYRDAEQMVLDGSTSSSPQGDTRVWVVQLRGRFICAGCKGPAAGSTPTGNAVALILNARTYAGYDFTITKQPHDLTRLGMPIQLPM